MRKSLDLTGMRFGRLVAEYKTSKRDYKGSVYWHCRCDCGNEINVPADGLRTGNNLSCGCLKRMNQKHINETLHLVDGTCLDWLEKRKSRSDNTSGCQGVSRLKNGKYRVNIGFKGKRYYLGVYSDLGKAIAVRKKAEEDIHEAFVASYHKWQKYAENNPEWAGKNPLIFEVVKDRESKYRVINNIGESERGGIFSIHGRYGAQAAYLKDYSWK